MQGFFLAFLGRGPGTFLVWEFYQCFATTKQSLGSTPARICGPSMASRQLWFFGENTEEGFSFMPGDSRNSRSGSIGS